MFASIESWERKVSWVTMAIWFRRTTACTGGRPAVDEDAALCHVVEARDEIGQIDLRRRSCRRGDHLASPHGEADILEGHLAVLVAEPHVVEFDRPAEVVERDRIRRIGDRGLEG